MSDAFNAPFGSKPCLDMTRNLMRIQIILFGQSLKAMSSFDHPSVEAVGMLCNSVLANAKSIAILIENDLCRDCFVIGRSMFETTVNACYIATQGIEVTKQAYTHAIQKHAREAEREFEFLSGGVKLSPNPDKVTISYPQFVIDAMADYTHKSGRENTSWTSEKIEGRIEKIGTILGVECQDRLRFILFGIYRIASEFAHGTLYSALYFEGYFADRSSDQNFPIIHKGGLATEICILMIGCLELAAKAIAHFMEDPAVCAETDKMALELKKFAWLNDATIRDDGYIIFSKRES